ncbi:MAG: hypothetical protein K2L78_02490, partial [Muribaculaceae bacterium]|nr:hypothetical protein [Muribaculaceae bacterium]
RLVRFSLNGLVFFWGLKWSREAGNAAFGAMRAIADARFSGATGYKTGTNFHEVAACRRAT